eukprot:13972219-Alexandrium_andersonii.AAC.1
MAPQSRLGRSARQGAGALTSDSEAPPSSGSSGAKPGRKSVTRLWTSRGSAGTLATAPRCRTPSRGPRTRPRSSGG